MGKKNLLVMAVSIFLATANAPTATAQEVGGVEISTTSILPITGVTAATDGNYNFKSFEVEASKAGAYYTEFWLLPSKYADHSYSTFLIYLNDSYVGSINPTVGNWQSARVKDHETFNLTEGKNVITIATLAPEFPEVETLRIAKNDEEATFASEPYEAFIEDAAAGVTYYIPEDDGMSAYASDATGVGLKHFSNLPLNYTFYKTFSFTKDQEIFITTSSAASHKIDVVYYGSESKFLINPDISNSTNTNSLIVNPGITPPIAKYRLLYTPATSEEMQGLSWVFPSGKSINSSTQLATARITIPKSGKYLIRVRHASNGGSAIADVNVNGAYYYTDVPITLTYKDCVIPADNNYYATFTCCNNFGTDDPYLFIHGARCDKIVGFNDDAQSAKAQQYNISTWDSYISQKYLMETSGISVSNYSSSKPTSRCNIVARISEGAAQSVAKARAKGGNCFADSQLSSNSDGADGVIGGHEYVDLGLPSGTLWATYNVGATSPYEKGDYFAWGEVEPREDFSWENYKFFERYEVDPNNGEWAVLENIGNDISGTEYDAARYQWGNGWRLPNEQERYELRMLCWCNGPTIENGVKGVRIHGPNEHSIFLPVCGFGLWYGQETIFDKTDGAYWTGVEEPQCGYNGRPIEPSMIARALLVDTSGFTGATSMKAQGLNIRAVVNPKESGIDNVISETEKIRLVYRNGYIHIMGCHSEGIISVFDLSGRIVYSGSVIDGICQLPELVSGIYMVSYTDNKNSTTTQKITI